MARSSLTPRLVRSTILGGVLLVALPHAALAASTHAPAGIRPMVLSDTGSCTDPNGHEYAGGDKIYYDYNRGGFCDRYLGDGTTDLRSQYFPGCSINCEEGNQASSIGTLGSTGSGTIASPDQPTRLHFGSNQVVNFPSGFNDDVSYLCVNVYGQVTCPG